MGQLVLHSWSFRDPLLIPLLGPFGYWICAPITLYFRDSLGPFLFVIHPYTGPWMPIPPALTSPGCQMRHPSIVSVPTYCCTRDHGFSPLTLYLRDSLGIFVFAKHFEQLYHETQSHHVVGHKLCPSQAQHIVHILSTFPTQCK